ncbi:CHAT domain-containing tetratricopeptide repeat protein [Pedobacter sp. P351]|uniref:CHAT domain-containing protein n=1 Tax=Pedobacter superstes TaxID=3133441 RepID=UPI00309D371C
MKAISQLIICIFSIFFLASEKALCHAELVLASHTNNYFISPSATPTHYNERKTLDTELSALRQDDKLTDWLYARIAYNAENPRERLPFLMATESETWRKPQTNDENEAWLNLLINQGYYQLYTGNVLKSIEQYEKAYAFYQRKPLKSFDLVEYIFKPLGNNYTRLGDYSNALFIQNKSLTIASAKSDSLTIASIYSNLAISYKSMGDLKQAEKACLKGFGYLPPKHSLSGLLYNTLADIEYEKGDYVEAGKKVQLALYSLSGNKSSNSLYWLLSAYTLAGNIELRKNNFITARLNYNKGLQLIEHYFKGSRNREKANLLIQSGNISIAQKEPEIALNFYNQALQILRPDFRSFDYGGLPSFKHLYSENRLYDALEGRGNALSLMKKQDEALNNYLLALATGNKSRNEFANADDRVYYQKQSKRLAEVAITTAYDLWIKTKKKKYSLTILGIAEQTKARTLLDQIQRNQQSVLNTNNSNFKEYNALKRAIAYYQKEHLLHKESKALLNNLQETQYKLAILDKKIQKRYPSWNKTNTIESFPAEKLINQIPSKFTIINFFWGEKAVYIINAKQGNIDTIIRLDNTWQLKPEISNFIQFYFKHGPSAMVNNPEKFFKSSHQVYRRLLSKSLQNELQQLVIIPDDILAYLPFESLITNANYSMSIAKWPFLIKKTPISYAYSLQTWLSPAIKAQSDQKGFSGFFISKSIDENISIPAVAIEAEKLGKQLKGKYFIDEDASITPFKHALNTSKVLHLSTHSFMFGPLAQPALQLADGKFFLFELSAIARVPNLMVLSSCRTADGTMASGEGVLSLSRGFTAAGTNGVVASLWNINDGATSQLMTSFYENLQKRKDAAISLHQAKIVWITQEHSNSALLLPYYWSSLIYIGKPQIISLENANNYIVLYVALLGIPLVIMTGYFFRKRKK